MRGQNGTPDAILIRLRPLYRSEGRAFTLSDSTGLSKLFNAHIHQSAHPSRPVASGITALKCSRADSYWMQW
jgi:hypothetical protein